MSLLFTKSCERRARRKHRLGPREPVVVRAEDSDPIRILPVGGEQHASSRLEEARRPNHDQTAIVNLLNLLGLPKPYTDVVQGLIIIGAVAYVGLSSQKKR